MATKPPAEGVETFVLRIRFFPYSTQVPGNNPIRIQASSDPRTLTELSNRLLNIGVVKEAHITSELVKSPETELEKHISGLLLDALSWREYKEREEVQERLDSLT